MKIIEVASSSLPGLPLTVAAQPRSPGRAAFVAALVALLGSMAAIATGLGVDIALAQPEKRTVTMGRIGDRWLDTIQFRKIERATRGKTFGYNITYDLTGPDSHVLFWPRDRIDFHGRSPRYRLEVMPLGTGRLWYPDRITATSLPDVHRCILMIEGDYVKQADGAIAAMEGFATVAGLGASVPALRAPIPKPVPRTPLPTLAPRSATPPAAAARGGAQNIANGPRLTAQLTRQEAAAVFTRSGALRPEVIAGAKVAVPGNKLGNPALVQRLTAIGGDISDWAKMTTQTFKSPSGAFQVHFYQNLKTGVVYYGDDFKVVFNHQGAW